MLAVTVHGVRWLARTGQLPYETTGSGQRLFRLGDVSRLVDQRATTRLTGMAAAPAGALSGGPRQLALFGKARLRIEVTKDRLSDTRGIVE
jgi:hypothetical protein